MYITYLGHSCFKLENKEKQVSLITDPYNKDYGLRVPKMASDIVTVSHKHKDHSNISAVAGIDGKPFIINMPGEYEIKGIFVYGIPSFHDNEKGAKRGDNIIYRIEIDGVSIVHLGDLGHILPNNAVEALEGVDIVLIPVGGNYTIGAKEASQVISQIEPRIVIPMHYKTKELTLDISPVDDFLKEMGASNPERMNKLKITKKDLPQDRLQVVVMGE